MQKLASATALTELIFRNNIFSCRYLSSVVYSQEHARCTAQGYLLCHPNKNTTNYLNLPTLTPAVISVRHVRPNTKRPAIPCKSRALALELTFEKYKYPLEGLPPTETCISAVKESVGVAEVPDNPFERILAREFLAEVEAGPMMAVFHRHPCSADDLFDMRVQIHRSNMKYLYHNTKVVKRALQGTKYENLLRAYECSCGTAVCYDTDIQKLLKLDRRLPYLTLMCAVVDGRIMSLQQLRDAVTLPPLPLMRATLLQTLGTQAQCLSQNLTHHQTELSGALSRYCDDPLPGEGGVDACDQLSSQAADADGGSSASPTS